MNGVIIDMTERERDQKAFALDPAKVAALDARIVEMERERNPAAFGKAPGIATIRERIKNAPRVVDCRSGGQDSVILDADVALMLGQAFIDLANEKRIVAMDLTGAEEINRAFQAIEKMGKALVE